MPQNNKKDDIHRISSFCCSESARRGSNPRPPPWQGGAPPLSHSRIKDIRQIFCLLTMSAFAYVFSHKAGDGNRTHVSSLEGWCSTIELHPHIYKALGQSLMQNAQSRNRTSDTRIFSPLLYQLSYLGT